MQARRMQLSEGRGHVGKAITNTNYSSQLPEVYSGAVNRVDRYAQYETMDLDSHISASLDIISEFCTQIDPVTKIPFIVNYTEPPTETDTDIITESLVTWNRLNDFSNILFDVFRDILKYGDQFFIRDPETYEWLRVNQNNIEKVIVDENEGKRPEQYVIRDLDLNLQTLGATQLPTTVQNGMQGMPGSSFNSNASSRGSTGGGSQTRFGNGLNSVAVNAEHIVHVNTVKRGDANWPFGTSVLEKVFKTYKQKELLEDAILVYRIQRAPMRRIFYVDVGDLPEARAMQFIDQVKNSVSQRRIPSKTGGGNSVMDASYSPISILDDFFFPQRSDGRGSKVDTLAGGDSSWGIDELQFFDNKLARGLRVPSSYLPTGPEDSNASYNDGKVGTALIQEFRFSEMCKRIQRAIIKKFDQEFKLYLKKNDVNIDCGSFELGFVEPQSFVAWRQIDIDSSRIGNFNQLVQNPFLSKRWLMSRFLGLSKDEINENHEMLMEENPSKFESVMNVSDITSNDAGTPVDLRDVGFNQGDFDEDEAGDFDQDGLDAQDAAAAEDGGAIPSDSEAAQTPPSDNTPPQ